jgi:hypothetical protein
VVDGNPGPAHRAEHNGKRQRSSSHIDWRLITH